MSEKFISIRHNSMLRGSDSIFFFFFVFLHPHIFQVNQFIVRHPGSVSFTTEPDTDSRPSFAHYKILIFRSLNAVYDRQPD